MENEGIHVGIWPARGVGRIAKGGRSVLLDLAWCREHIPWCHQGGEAGEGDNRGT